MRIITGKYRGRHFDVPRTFKARPTTDFAKENLFNVLQAYFDFEAEHPRALDLFAGTGSITLELLSRGCSQVVAIEKEALHCSFIKKFLSMVGDSNGIVLRADVLRYLPKATGPFNLIFADPPYALPELAELPDMIFQSTHLLAPQGLFILEHGKAYDFHTHPHFIEQRVYGSVHFSLFQ